jgi:predicted enzyme related to lactoylglutathione lyase
MRPKSMELVWIVVKDLKMAIKFYTEIVGLKLMTHDETFGWAELECLEGGARLGIAQMHESELKAGTNAYMTFVVDDIEQARKEIASKGAKLVGDLQEVPGHVKLQMIVDGDGNHFQLVQKLQ